MATTTRWLRLVAFAICFCGVCSSGVFADEREQLEDLIEELSEKAEVLRDAEAFDELREVERQMEHRRNELERIRHEQNDEGENSHRERFVRQIAQAVDALRELGRHEEAELMAHVVRDLRREGDEVHEEESGRVIRRRIVRNKDGQLEEEIHEREFRRDHESEEHREIVHRRQHDGEGEHAEVEEAEHRRDGRVREARRRERDEEDGRRPGRESNRQALRAISTAIEVLADTDREVAAESLHDLVRSHERALAGDGEQSRRAMRISGHQREALMLAGRTLEERGRRDQAREVFQLVERLGQGNRPEGGRREQELDRLNEHVRDLQRQLEEIQNHLRRLR